ncbi:MAG: DUF1501 domain-containing protein [Pseudomonadota bacterium]|jgi:uncharacterized protein (DUF1501 family)
MAVHHRRDFLRRSLAALAGSAAFAALPAKMALAQGASLRQLRGAGIDYRALVCIYLYGGNDCFNMVVPTDTGATPIDPGRSYGAYAATRTNLAIPVAQLRALAPVQPPSGGAPYGLHPEMEGLAQLFNAQRAAIVANVGPLVRPVNKTTYQQPGTPLPPQLFSHSDQSVVWQSPRADSIARTGWGGRLADVFFASNANPTLSMNVSLAGENVFQAGESVLPYFMSASGVERINMIETGAANCADGGQGWNRRRCLTFNALQDATYAHPFQRAYAQRLRATRETSRMVEVALATVPRNDPVFQPFWTAFGLQWNATDPPALPDLGEQLLMIARMIRARTTLQMSRQLFFAGIGGFDTHDYQLNDHGPLLRQISAGLKGFYDVLAQPSMALTQQVTAFTASEFGRTLSNNGDGTDHGWGGHHVVVGGAVNGGRIYGRMPNVSGNPAQNPDDAGWGQIIPTLAVDQYAATLATWFGLSAEDRAAIFPNLQYMTGPMLSIPGSDLGFMQAV